MPKCYLCPNDLTGENVSKEHILPNAIGGRLQSDKLLCRNCNSRFGEGIDGVLAKQLLPFSSMLQIKKQRGEAVDLKNLASKSGEKYNLVDGQKPELMNPKVDFKKEETGGTRVNITARNIKEMKQILAGVSRKYKINVDEMLTQIVEKSGYMREPIQMSFKIGGKDMERAVAKIAINYFIYNGGNPAEVEHTFPFIKGEMELPIVNPYLTEQNLIPHEEGEILHTVHLVGSPEKRQLFAYVQLFSCFSFVVSLSSNYSGSSISATYCINPLTGLTFNKNIIITPPDQLLYGKQCSDYNLVPIAQERLKRLFAIVDKRQSDQHINEKATEIVNAGFSGTPEGEIISKEDMEKLIEDLSVWFAEYLVSRNPESDEMFDGEKD
jgi:hypothetical protein